MNFDLYIRRCCQLELFKLTIINVVHISSENHTHRVQQNKKDNYRQQNVRQRKKLISIIDYDVCMTFY